MIKKKKIDLISKIAIALMILSVLTTLFFLYNQNVQECTSNPLVYSAKLYEDNFDISKATGSLTLWGNDPRIKSTIIIFNSSSFYVLE